MEHSTLQVDYPTLIKLSTQLSCFNKITNDDL